MHLYWYDLTNDAIGLRLPVSRNLLPSPAINFPANTVAPKPKLKNYFISHLYLIHLEYLYYIVIELLTLQIRLFKVGNIIIYKHHRVQPNP